MTDIRPNSTSPRRVTPAGPVATSTPAIFADLLGLERSPVAAHTAPVEPHVSVATPQIQLADGTFLIGRDSFPQFAAYRALGVHVQSDRVRLATPDPEYVETALTVLAEACRALWVPEASVAFVDTVVPPPAFGLRYGFKGAFTPDYPNVIWVFANWTTLAELRETIRHEAAHLAFARTHTPEESAGHSGPSEDFALAFEKATTSEAETGPPVR